MLYKFGRELDLLEDETPVTEEDKNTKRIKELEKPAKKVTKKVKNTKTKSKKLILVTWK